MSKSKSPVASSLSRRSFLKGAAYTSALSVGAVSSVAYAVCGTTAAKKQTSKARITLINQSHQTVALDATTPVSIENIGGWVVANINKASAQSILDLNVADIVTIGAGQTMTFEVPSALAALLPTSASSIVITSEYSAQNNMVPLTTFDSLVA